MFKKNLLTKITNVVIISQVVLGSISVIAIDKHVGIENESHEEKEALEVLVEEKETNTNLNEGELSEIEEKISEEIEEELEQNDEKIESSTNDMSQQSTELISETSDENVYFEEENIEKNIVAQGVSGSAKWELFEEGLLLVKKGTLGQGGSIATSSPWSDYTSQINRIEFEPTVVANVNSGSLFRGLTNVVEFIGMENLDTSNVSQMNHMFNGLSNIVKIDVRGFDTKNVTTMQNMFSSMSQLEELDIRGFDTSNVTNLSGMFTNLSTLRELDVSGFDTSNVTTMDSMFTGMTSLLNLDIHDFKTSKVTTMSNMFSGMSGLTKLEITNFNTSNVVDMNRMFTGMSGLLELDVSRFDTRNVLNMSFMFGGLSSLTELDVRNFDTRNVTNMSNMFQNVTSVTELDASNFDTSNVTTMQNMFNGMNRLIKLDIRNFNTGTKSDNFSVSGMFTNTTSMNSLTLGSKFKFFATNAGLPAITQSGYIGRWIGINTGTVFGSSILLMTHFSGEADTYIWEELKVLDVRIPVRTLFISNKEDPTKIESSTYTITNHSTHPVHVFVSVMTEKRLIEDIDLLQMNGISLIEKGETTLVEDHLLATLSLGDQQQFSYTGQAKPVTSESNPSFKLFLKFSF